MPRGHLIIYSGASCTSGIVVSVASIPLQAQKLDASLQMSNFYDRLNPLPCLVLFLQPLIPIVVSKFLMMESITGNGFLLYTLIYLAINKNWSRWLYRIFMVVALTLGVVNFIFIGGLCNYRPFIYTEDSEGSQNTFFASFVVFMFNYMPYGVSTVSFCSKVLVGITWVAIPSICLYISFTEEGSPLHPFLPEVPIADADECEKAQDDEFYSLLIQN